MWYQRQRSGVGFVVELLSGLVVWAPVCWILLAGCSDPEIGIMITTMHNRFLVHSGHQTKNSPTKLILNGRLVTVIISHGLWWFWFSYQFWICKLIIHMLVRQLIRSYTMHWSYLVNNEDKHSFCPDSCLFCCHDLLWGTQVDYFQRPYRLCCTDVAQ